MPWARELEWPGETAVWAVLGIVVLDVDEHDSN